MRISILLCSSLIWATGCVFVARNTKGYRDDTQKLLDSKREAIKSCYDEQLKADSKVAGVVAVQMVVERKTGKFTKVQLDQSKTTAPANVSTCVTQELEKLQLDPPDQRDGVASFTWEFSSEGAATPTDPAAAPAASSATPQS